MSCRLSRSKTNVRFFMSFILSLSNVTQHRRREATSECMRLLGLVFSYFAIPSCAL